VPFNNLISRADADALIPEDVAGDAIAAATEESAALQLFRRVSLGTKITSMPVLSALPVAYWVNGDTGLKQTTEAAWAGIQLTAEEIATILPVPEAVLDDAGFDVWGELRPALGEAVAALLDAAVFAGTNKPASWPAAVIPAAIAAGNIAELGTSTPEQGGVVGDLESAFDAVEADGFDVTGVAAEKSLRGLLRKARDGSGQKLADVSSGSIEGVPIQYVMPGAFTATAKAVVGDFQLGVIGIRQDLSYKLLDQAVITDDTGAIVYNLPQQDMVAMRVTARFAYAVANPITRAGAGGATQYPFAVMQDATP